MKLNSADFTDGGMTEEESGNLCERLDEYLDLIELSGGHYESSAVAFSHQKESTKKREGYFVEVRCIYGLHLILQKADSSFSSLPTTSDLVSRRSSLLPEASDPRLR